MTVSAVAKFIPRPPALVESKKINLSEFSSLNDSIYWSLSSRDVEPSILQKLCFLKIQKSSKIFNMVVNYEKINTLWFSFFSFSNN